MTGHDGAAPPGTPAPGAQPPAAPATPASFEDEIDAAISYEKGLTVKALVAIALVAVILALRVYFSG